MPVHDRAKKAIPVHYLVRLSQHTINCGMGPKTPRIALLLWLEIRIEIGAFYV